MPSDDNVVVYVTIGNSDDKLTQRRWADFCRCVEAELNRFAIDMHGVWYSKPDVQWQNMVGCITMPTSLVHMLKRRLAELKDLFEQDAIAVAVTTEVSMV